VPSPTPCLTEDDARAFVRAHDCTPCAEALAGVEVEWLVHDPTEPTRPVSLDEIRTAAGDPSSYVGRLTFEPGGQIEISSRPHSDVATALVETAADVALLSDHTAHHGLRLTGYGLDPWRPPVRVLNLPRYAAMELYLRHTADPDGAMAGPTMMCSTASIQVNVALGRDAAEVHRRWRLVHRLGPILAAAFANSPLGIDGPTGFRSSRLATWAVIDPSRTAAVERDAPPSLSWPAYAMAARVMLIRHGPNEYVAQTEPMTFAEWIAGGHALGHPTVDDLEYHLTTLFPPVRPRGWLELRMFDALPSPWWQVPALVVTALLDDAAQDAPLTEATAGTDGRWQDAAAHALCHPDFASAASRCFELAVGALRGSGRAAEADLVAAYAAGYTDAGRTPADDTLDAWAAPANGGRQ